MLLVIIWQHRQISTHTFHIPSSVSLYLETWFLYQYRWAHRSAAVSEGGWPPRPQTDVRQMHQPAAWSHHTHPHLADSCTPTACEGQRWMKRRQSGRYREKQSNYHHHQTSTVLAARTQSLPTFWKYPGAGCESRWETSCGCVHLTDTTDNWATEDPNLGVKVKEI